MACTAVSRLVWFLYARKLFIARADRTAALEVPKEADHPHNRYYASYERPVWG